MEAIDILTEAKSRGSFNLGGPISRPTLFSQEMEMAPCKIYYRSPDACTGCRICEIVCSLHHEDSEVNPKLSRIRVVDLPDRAVSIPVVCRKCSPAPCVDACPVDALSQDEETELIIVDEGRCTGCDRCAEACEFGAITTHPVKKAAIVCDECGGDPLCVKYCMPEALVYLAPEEYRMMKATESVERDVSHEWAGGSPAE